MLSHMADRVEHTHTLSQEEARKLRKMGGLWGLRFTRQHPTDREGNPVAISNDLMRNKHALPEMLGTWGREGRQVTGALSRRTPNTPKEE